MEESGGDVVGGGGGRLDVVLFPWLAFGHMIPFLELAKRLSARGHDVTYVSTPRNVARLPPVPPHLADRVRFVALPMPRVDGLPDGAECTADVPPGMDGLVKKACDDLAPAFAAFLADEAAGAGERRRRRPDWVVIDFCHHWVPPIADQHKVPCAVFQIVHAGMVAFFGSRWANAAHPRTAVEDFTVPPKWFPSSSTVAYRRHEAGWLTASFMPNASIVTDIERIWRTMEGSRLIFYRSCVDVEPGMFDLLTDLFGKPAVPAGILPPPTHLDDDDDDDLSDILQWLDGQPAMSVVYVALGSEAPVTAKNLHELALGLELAGVRFLWALRKPLGAGDAEAVLPDGFEERTRERGAVRKGWVPQVKVLAHDAVGAFLTHCGWGSTLESLAFGHPLVMLPFVVDQGLIARAMAERGIGVEIARDEDDGSFDGDAVAAAVRRVMLEEEGKVIASNAKKLQVALLDQGRQEQYIDELVGYLNRYKNA